MMIIDVPPNETEAPNIPENAIGITEMILNPIAPINTVDFTTLARKSLVGVPGRTPGITPLDLLRLSAISSGLNVILV